MRRCGFLVMAFWLVAGPAGAAAPLVLAPAGAGRAAEAPETKFYSVLAGRFLDEAPARRLAASLRKRGLTAFTTKRALVESRLFFDRSPAGEFHLALAGLFGRAQEAERLGGRLAAEGLVADYRTVEIEDPGEMESSAAQNLKLDRAGAATAEKARARAEAPLSPAAAEAVDEAYKQTIMGRYIASFRDPLAAKDEARRLTGAGWEASVFSEGRGEGRWYRVYLAPAADIRAMKSTANAPRAAEAAAAKASALVILADLTSTQGRLNVPGPEPGRRDASACAGFSEAGRLGAILNRTIGQPLGAETTTALVAGRRDDIKNLKDASSRLDDWWEGRERRPAGLAAYGPAFFNRPALERAVQSLTADPRPGSLMPAFKAAGRLLSGRGGRRVLLVFSNFLGPDKPAGLRAAADELKAGAELVVVYGDADGQGYRLAQSLAQGAAWDGCRLLHDDAYFGKYLRSLLK